MSRARSRSAPWEQQLVELAGVYPDRSSLAAELAVTSATVGGWLDRVRRQDWGHEPTTANKIEIAELYSDIVPIDLVVQAVVLATQSVEGVLEMETVRDCHAHARRCLEKLRALPVRKSDRRALRRRLATLA